MRRFTRAHRSDAASVAVEKPPRSLRGVELDLDGQAARLRQLAPLIRGFRAPEGFRLGNGEYDSVDAEVLWAMVAGLRPQRALAGGLVPMAAKVLDAALPASVARTGDPSELEARDVLIAGEPNAALVLDVLPALAPGVVVHFHPVRLPWRGGHGQDLLHAFLCGNRDVEVLLSHHVLSRRHPELVREAVPSWRGGQAPAALWLRRV